MVLRPEDIEQREFGSAMRGFDKAEVRAFLRRVAGEVRYLESEIEATRPEGDPSLGDLGKTDGDDPSIDPESRPAPPLTLPAVDNVESGEDRLPNLGAPGSELPATESQPAVSSEPDAPAPLSSRIAATVPEPQPATMPEPQPVSSPEADADRFAALGDRIADLLRNAQETAEQVRRQAEADAQQLRSDAAAASEELRTSADTYSIEVRAAADAESASNRRVAEELLEAAQAEAAEIREHALADANEMRSAAANELETARSEVPQIRQRAIDEGRATLTSREADIAQRETQVAAEREQALAELADARSQVSVLLQEARAQSEFIRQESEEIIRTKVRANMEQAQRRIDMLRTTETASKDRIAAARKELESAMARLEAEPAPSLPPGTEELVLDEARQAADQSEGFLQAGSAVAEDRGSEDRVSEDRGSEGWASAERASNGNIVEGSVVEGTVVGEEPTPTPTDLVESSGMESERTIPETAPSSTSPSEAAVSGTTPPETTLPETTLPETTLPETASPSRLGEFDAGHVDTGGIEVESVSGAGFDPGGSDVIDSSVVDAPSVGDSSEPGADLSAQGGSFFGPRTESDAEAQIEPPPPPGFDRPVGVDAPVFSAPERPQVPDPLEGLASPTAPDADQGVATPAHDASVDESSGSAGADFLTDAGGDHVVFGEPSSPEEVSKIDTPENEDALAKLVREAMQRAVDSARGKEG